MDLRVGSVCDRGLSQKRPVNEDRCLVLPAHGLFVVCDGVGGHNSGEVASQLAVDTIEEALAQFEGGDVEDLLRNAIRYANRDIFEMASSQQAYDGMGTTIALLYLDEDARRAIIGHAGDSRVYRFDGSLHRETYDHTDLDDALRAGRISRQQAVHLGKQNTINRALGIESDVLAEYKTIPLVDGEAYLLCSDGVTRHVDDDEIEELFATGLAPDEMCEEIRARCYARGAEDNLTAVVVHTGSFAADVGASQPARTRIDFDRAPIRRAPPASRRPRSALLRVAIAVVLLAMGGVAGYVIGRFTADSSGVTSPPPSQAAIGRAALERGDPTQARAVFAKLASDDPTRADYQYWLGRACLEQGEAHEAVVHLEESVRLDAQPREPYLFLAAAYQSDDRPREATDALKRYFEAHAPAAQPVATPSPDGR